ncbi:MAG: DNA-binding protein, partial [Spirochaetes bacterium]|nr:DNA-binding protein [Spirochaetota bacterium]
GKYMEVMKGKTDTQIIFIRLDPDEDVLECLKKMIDNEKIKNGVVLTGLGCLKKCHFHQADLGNPPSLIGRRQNFINLEGTYEVSSLSGIIADGEPHLHITFGHEDKAYSGHLESGSIVSILFEMTVLKVNASIKRVYSSGQEMIKQLTKK